MTVAFLDLAAVHSTIAGDLEAAVLRVVRSGRYVLGPEVEAFEAEWAAFVGARHCVSVGTGLDALTLALKAVGVGPDDEVVVPAHTFVATWLAVRACGARPVPVDVDPATHLASAEHLRVAVSTRTRAIVPVHLYGTPLDSSAIGALADEYGIAVVEDAAQAHGARYGGIRIGGFGRTACWSFYPGKNLGALGDGGAVTTDDPDLARRLRLLRNYGSEHKYVHETEGGNSRLDEVQAAVLRVKLTHLEYWNARRTAIAARYTAALTGVLGLPAVSLHAEPAWHLYVVQSSGRDRLAELLERLGIGTLVHYPTPPHRQPAFLPSHRTAALPVAERLAAEVLSLPMGPHLDDAAVEQVIAAVGSSLRNH